MESYRLTEVKINTGQPISLKFLIGFSYYYDGKMELMLSKEFTVLNIVRLYQINYCPDNIFIIPPEDLKNLKVLIESKSFSNDSIEYPNFYNRFGVHPVEVINPIIQRALFCNNFGSKIIEKDGKMHKFVFSKDSNNHASKEYLRLTDRYPRNIVNREMFLGAKYADTNKYFEIETNMFKALNVSGQYLDNVFKLPDSIQKIFIKYKKDLQIEFDFGE